ncbi:imaginal disc development protein B4 isoform X2 [Lycorma delicatula]|uniref:imaginal disc development protein B4 isoform X2 n=1 Tax=Lycorma delicatula TaxID=130591 RepID=UPI003F517344
MAAVSERRPPDSGGGVSYCKTSSLQSYSSMATSSSSDEHLTPRTFLERYSLPRIVRIVPQEPVDALDSGPMSLLSGQLLMYKQYRSGKVEARSQVKTKNGSDMLSLIVIPDTYQGWFSLVTERRQIKARCYSSLQRLVAAQVTVFLTMTDIQAYTHNNRTMTDGTRQQYSKTVVRYGQVLKLLAVYQDLANQSTRSKRLSWPLIGRHEANRYAQCLSNTDQVLFIPLTTHGQFYAVATATNTTEDTVSKVYQLPKLLRTFPLPVRVCIITPNKPQGSMLLESYRKEDVILTCLLDSCSESYDEENPQFRLLEMDVNSRFFVLRLSPREMDERRLFQSGLVQKAMRYCRENSDRWCRQLKVIHHIYPRENMIEHTEQTSSKQRKVSLGDKKTVKSASFRFSTSYHPDDLLPVNQRIQQRQIQAKNLVRVKPPPEPVYSDYDSVPLYSNVPDEEPKSLQIASKHQTVWATPLHQSATALLEPQFRKLNLSHQQHKDDPSKQWSESNRVTEPPIAAKQNEYKTKITINDSSQQHVFGTVRPMYRVIRKSPGMEVKPFFKTRVQIGPDYSASTDVPYSVVVDHISTPEDNVYAEIGDSYQSSESRYFSFGYQQQLRHYDYKHGGGSDGTFSNTTSSSSNADESSV